MMNHKSKRMEQHQNKLRNRALKENDEEKRKDYWSLYFDAKAIEYEHDSNLKEAHVCRLLDMMTVYGAKDMILEDERENPPEDKPDKPDDEPPDHDDKIPPRQMGFWE
jgi:protease II